MLVFIYLFPFSSHSVSAFRQTLKTRIILPHLTFSGEYFSSAFSFHWVRNMDVFCLIFVKPNVNSEQFSPRRSRETVPGICYTYDSFACSLAHTKTRRRFLLLYNSFPPNKLNQSFILLSFPFVFPCVERTWSFRNSAEWARSPRCRIGPCMCFRRESSLGHVRASSKGTKAPMEIRVCRA